MENDRPTSAEIEAYTNHIRLHLSPAEQRLWKSAEIRSFDDVPCLLPDSCLVSSAGPGVRTVALTLAAEYEQFQREMGRIMNILYSAGYPPFLVKGPGMQRYYPPQLFRRFHDLDVVVDSPETLWQVATALGTADYHIEGATISQPPWASDSPWTGFFKFARPDQEWPAVEVHVGGFSISTQTGIPYKTLLSHSQLGHTFGMPCRILTDEAALIVLIAEQYSRFSTKPRDYIDLYYLALNGSCHPQRIAILLQEYQLELFWRRLVGGLVERVGELHLPSLLTSGAPRPARVVQPWARYFQSWNFSRHRYHVFPILAGSKGVIRASRLTLLNYLDEWKNELVRHERHLWLVRLLSLSRGPSASFRAGRLVILIPLAPICGSWQWERLGRREILRTPAGSFLLTVDLLDTDSDLSQARHASEDVFAS